MDIAQKNEKCLITEESKPVGWDSGDGEPIGHKSGEKTVRLLRKKKADLTSATQTGTIH